MEWIWHIANETSTDALAAALAPQLHDGDTVLLEGDLGTGKTRFTKGIAAALGYAGEVTSPTFTIMQRYETPSLLVHHIDLYRLDSVEQLEDIGFYEAVDTGTPGVALIEWADLFPDDMPDDALQVRIASDGPGCERKLEAHARGPRSKALLSAWAAQSDVTLA